VDECKPLITGLLGDDSATKVDYFDDKFKSSVVAPAPAAPKADFVDFYAAAPAVTVAPVAPAVVEAVAEPAAAASDAVVAYEGEVAAEPLRVEGAVDADVEQDAVDMELRAVDPAADADAAVAAEDAAETAAGM
jgi:hypothetical protein